jgi:LL-diaminopimelate aminotransferase
MQSSRRGVDVIDLGVGNPDMRPAPRIVEALEAALDDKGKPNHRYPSFNGLPEFRRSIAAWYDRRFGVRLDPDTEVLPLHRLEGGDRQVLLRPPQPRGSHPPDDPLLPGVRRHRGAHAGDVYNVPLTVEHAFRPNLDAIPGEVADRAHLITINFPGNPTGGTETPEFYDKLNAWATKHDTFVISDIAYCDLSLEDGYRSRSFLEFDREKKRSVEYHSFSKSYSMQGWRVGFVVGNADAIGRLQKIKANMDFGVFTAIQRAAMAALDGPQDYCAKWRRSTAGAATCSSRASRGWASTCPRRKAGMYVWLPIPKGYGNSLDFTADLLEKTGVVVSPGSGFGTSGRGLRARGAVRHEERIRLAVRRMAEAGISAEMAKA